jgi:uncharacterized protein YecE (DUF72 family)
VELNNTFYQIPTPARIAAWSAAAHEPFRFVLKAPREIPAAVEFRHGSWFTEETYRILEANAAALCINDADDRDHADPSDVAIYLPSPSKIKVHIRAAP